MGFPQDASDQVMAAYIELWEHPDLTRDEVYEIADQWVTWDADDNPWPRPLATNVVPMRR